MVPRDVGIAIPSERHLTLFRHLEAAVDGSRGLGSDRPRRRAATSAERAATAVEDGDLDACPCGPGGDRSLYVVERERGREHPHLLRGVRVAEHDLEAIPVRTQASAHCGQRDHGVEYLCRASQLGAGLEQTDDIEAVGQSRVRPPREGVRGGHIRGSACEAQDHSVAGLFAEPRLDVGHRPERCVDLVVGLGERPPDHIGMLAHLDRREVEPEGLDLASEVRELAVGERVRAARAKEARTASTSAEYSVADR